MPDPPQNPALQELWSELVKNGYDPEEFFENANQSGVYGGLHADRLGESFQQVIESVEDWEHLVAYAGPVETHPDDHHCEFAWSKVDWDDDENDWVPHGDTVQRYLERISDDLITVSHEDLSEETQPVMGTITDIPRDAVPQTVDALVEASQGNAVRPRFCLRPDSVGEMYEFTWEFVRWQGTPLEGQFEPIDI